MDYKICILVIALMKCYLLSLAERNYPSAYFLYSQNQSKCTEFRGQTSSRSLFFLFSYFFLVTITCLLL